MAQYPIPQFIEEEGKIVFFLTFKQFFLLVGGALACFLLNLLLPFFLFLPLAFVIMAVVVAIAFLKIESEPILKVLFHFLRFSTNNKNYLWKKAEYSEPYQLSEKIEALKTNTPLSKIETEKTPTLKTTTRSRLSETKKIIETKKG